MKCLYCKKELKLFEQYCPSCGKKVFDDDPPVEAPESLELESDEEEGNPAMTHVNLYWLNNL